MSVMSLIEKISNGLQSYYKSLNAHYFNADNIGKFQAWCDENGIDDEGLHDDLNQEDLDECQAVDFDENFPFPKEKQSLDENEKKAEIFRILEQCRDGFNFDVSLPDITQQDFDSLTFQDLEEISTLYQKFCPVLFNQDMGDDSTLLACTALQHKKRFAYLCHLVDAYNCYRIEVESSTSAQQWARLKDNTHFGKHLRKIRYNNISYEQLIVGAIESYCSRFAAKLALDSTMRRIDDRMEVMVSYIYDAAMFISNLLRQKKLHICPFQLDFCVAVGEPKNTMVKKDGTNNDDDDDEDDATDEKDEDYKDWIEDIEAKLKAQKLRYDVFDSQRPAARKFHVLLEQFFEKHKIANPLHNEEDDTFTHYLRQKRLVTFIDRRENRNCALEEKTDPIYMYDPPQGPYTRDIPRGNDFVNEWFLSASTTCLLPNIGYDEQDAIGSVQEKDDTLNQPGSNLGVNQHAQGGLVTLSFHVYAEDTIKLYLFWNAQSIRLLPRHIETVLKRLYVESEENKAYVEDQDKEHRLQETVTEIEKLLVDKEFDQWLDRYPIPQSKPNTL